ncbi:hypothetical protein EAI28_23400 [Faecalicatena contorta]|jgi:hypothetical protein|uniref:Uncharacterized protein n=1 Tax=Faecalicatena contorta TaxID=39482 RepID=A0A174J666_9FIRM|nr:hypothetical protein [Faecalicatena contorta]MRM91267.1 hypothetical protein [Faecalicatena contorta]CUO92599.1 Uncharacterised protein [[Eubacterium] contortum] [Faecalicatena contorta]
MSKWRVVRGINPNKYDALIDAGCRYMNSKAFPVIEELAAIIGLEEIPEEELCSEQVTEMEDGE